MEYCLWEHGAPDYDPHLGQPEPSVTAYPVDDRVRPCVIIAPGGAYLGRADHEGEPVAQMFNRAGFHAFVLNYRVAPYHYPAIAMDGLRAVRYVRYHAAEFAVDPDKIAVLGFSAGGHLATMMLELYDGGKPDGDEIDRVSARPNAGILCYAVITMGEYTHRETHDCLLAGCKTDAERQQLEYRLSGEDNLPDDMPPMFLWHTAADTCVPPENALQMAWALQKKGVPYALHIFPRGGHGLGLGTGEGDAEQWSGLCCKWLSEIGF